MANLSLTLTGKDGGLSSELQDVAEAAGAATEALKEAEDKVSNIADDMKAAASSSEDLKEALNDISGAASAAKKGASELDSESRDLIISLEGANVKLDDFASSSVKAGSSATVGADAFDQFEEQSQELRNAITGLTAAISAESAAAGASVGPNNAAAKSMDNMGDEAAEARNKMAGAASMAELLSLKSSALSINVGAFTIALRNLTTQVPLLVASLGNLAAAFAGVASAIGTVGMGGFAVALGGAVAHAEEITGPMATMEEKLQAMQAIGEEFMSMLREGIEPLVEMEGAADAFISLLEGIATTVRVFSESIADSYENGPLREAINTLSSAWMDSIVAIADAFSIMVRRMESAGLFDVFADGIEHIDEFIIFVTNVMEDMMKIMGSINENNALQQFFVELMQLGRQVASGLAPLMNVFLDVVGSVAEELSALGSESIGTAVQMVALALAVNKLISIVSGIAQPFAIFAGHLGEIVNKSNSVTEAMGRMARRMVVGLSSISGGFASLTNVIQTAMPFLDPDNNNMEKMFNRMQKGDGVLGKLRGKFNSVSNSIQTFSKSLSGSGDDAGFFISKLRGVRSSIAQLVATQAIAADDFNLDFLFDSQSVDFRPGQILSVDEVNEGLPATAVDVRNYIDDDVDTEFTGLTAIRKRLDVFRSRSVSRLQSINNAFFNRLIGLRDSISDAGDGVTGKLSAFAGRIYKGLSSVGDSISSSRIFSSTLKPDIRGSLSSINDSINEWGRNFNPDVPFGDKLQRWAESIELPIFSNLKSGLKKRLFGVEDTINTWGRSFNPDVPFGDKLQRWAENIEPPNFSNLKGRLTKKLSNIVPDVSFSLPSLETMRDSINSSILSFEKLSASSILSALSISSVTSSIAGYIPSSVMAAFSTEYWSEQLDEAADKSGKLGTVAGGLQGVLGSLTGVTATLGTVTDALGVTMIKSGGKTAVFGRMLRRLSVAMKGQVATTTALKSAYAVMVGRTASASMKQLAYASRTKIATAATSALTGAVSTLALAFGGITVVLGALVAIIGTAAAGLMLLGDSGQSAESVISGLKETLKDIGNAVMPFVVASGNMMLDVFSAIAKVGKSLIDGFTRIGVALGLLDPSEMESKGFIERLKAMAKAAVPVLRTIGELALVIGEELASVITEVISIIVRFIEVMHIAEIINIVSASVRYLAGSFGGLARIMQVTIGILSTLISGIVKISAIIGILVGAIVAAIGVIAVLNLGLLGTAGALWSIAIPIGAIPALIIAVVAAVIILLEKFGILDMILHVLMDTLGALMDLFVKTAKVIGNAITSLINKIKSLWNDTVGGIEILGFKIPEIEKGGGGDGDGGSGSAGESDKGSGDLFGGLDVLGGVGKAAKGAAMGGPAAGVEYNEGDTMNNYNQDISADPEDKAQMSRIAKDAMEEANSFARRQQGGQ